MLAKSPKTYRKHHLTRWRSGWRYRRRVPSDLVAVIRRAEWSKYLGPISEPDAIVEARKLDVDNDSLIGRAKRLTPAERSEVIKSGGLAKLESQTELEAKSLKYVEAISALFHETKIDPNSEDLGDQIKEIRESRDAGNALRGKIASGQGIVAKIKGDRPDANLAALIPVWQRVGAIRHPKTVKKMGLYVRRFVEVVGDLEPKAVRREHVIKFRDSLQQAKQSRSNIQTQLQALHRLFGIALSENTIDQNPVHGVKVAKTVTKFSDADRGKAFNGSQVKAILEATEGRNSPKQLGDVDLRWIICLLAYHGARSGEICQLRPSDVTTVLGVPVLRITDEAGSLKNRSSKREVPIHPKCLEIVAYAAAVADKPLLFMSLAKAKDKSSAFQQRGAKFLRKIVGISDPKL